MSSTRRLAAFGVGMTAAIGLLFSAAAWACISGPTLNLNPQQVKAGQPVSLSGFNYNGDLPIVVRFNALDGPILGTFTPALGRFGDPESIVGQVTIPANTKPGSYVLIATQSAADGSLAQLPVRALVTVIGPGGVPALGGSALQPEPGRVVGPVHTTSSVSGSVLALVGLGAAGVGMLFAGVAFVVLGRRRSTPEMARASR